MNVTDAFEHRAQWVAEKPFEEIHTGEVLGGDPAVQLPDVPCVLARFKACWGNLSELYLGTAAAVTATDGATDATTGFELAPGDDTGWIPMDNLNRLWLYSAAGESLTYLVLCQ